MRNCEFKKCTFIECNFEHIALSGSCFVQCKFENINLFHSSTYLNTYISCEFNDCNINGNFYYNLLLHNNYIKSTFDPKLFAYNYYLMENKNNFSALGLDSEHKEELYTYLQQNNLLINLVILGLNETNDVDLSLVRFIVAINEILKLGLLIREEQLQFIHKILLFLLEQEMISAVTIAETLTCLEKNLNIFETQNNIAYGKCKFSLNLIKNELYQAYEKIGQNITYTYDQNRTDSLKLVKIVYAHEPEIPICSILNEIKLALGISVPDAVRIKTEVGSFHEWISCYDSMLQCLQLFVAVLGLGYSIVSDYKKTKHKVDLEITDSQETTSEQMLAIVNKALSKQKINPEFSQTIQIIVKNDVIATKKFRGYSKSNIHSIDIITKNS